MRWRLPASSTSATAAHTIAEPRGTVPDRSAPADVAPAAGPAGEPVLAAADLAADELVEPGAAPRHEAPDLAVGHAAERAHLLAGVAQLAEAAAGSRSSRTPRRARWRVRPTTSE